MNTFRTTLSFSTDNPCISLSDRILTIGSCFSDAIGTQLVSNKLNAMVNPFGILYNPCSIHKALHYAIFNEPVPEDTFLQRNDVFLNYDFHSEHSSLNLNHLQDRLKSLIYQVHSFLRDARWLIITYGTAWVYERNDTVSVVANCHKMPQSMFTKSLLSQKKVLESFDATYRGLKSLNPLIKIIVTVSPVRHLKDTLELNSVSKSVLRMSCHTFTEQYKDVHYFPAYEIMMDDLRDYRFYKADMIHPTAVAEDYIWQKFGNHYFEENLKKFLVRWEEIRAALAHKPFHSASAAHQQFIRETLKKLEELKVVMNVDEEVETLRKQLR